MGRGGRGREGERDGVRQHKVEYLKVGIWEKLDVEG